jgi:uncharacterized membrane protein
MTPSRLRTTSIVLAVLGLAIAGYLTWVHYAGLSPVCVGGSHGCEAVQASRFADVAGIPVAVIGLAGYAALLLTALLPGYPARAAAAILALGGLAFSAYLTYVELFEIRAICQWCVASAVVMLLLTATLVLRAVREA